MIILNESDYVYGLYKTKRVFPFRTKKILLAVYASKKEAEEHTKRHKNFSIEPIRYHNWF